MTARHVVLVLLLLVSSCAATPPSTSSATTPEVGGGPQGVTGHRSGHALFYVVPVNGGVVLVDSGFDDSGTDIAAAACVHHRPVR